MKQKLNINWLEFTRRNKPKDLTVSNVVNQLWSKYSEDLSTTGSGNRVTKNQFKTYFEAYVNENIDNGMDIKQAIKTAKDSYQLSNRYISSEQRLSGFSLKDMFKDNKDNRRRFQELTKKNGRYTKFDPFKVKYQYSGYILDENKRKRHYRVDKYEDVAIVTWQSPENKIVMEFEQLDDYIEMMDFSGE